ncbi:beta-lactamase [Coprinopsis sp. MPI-PUGE-AT-0042]|nr:beta-lactamase [Coprinopsis sp. MPI-PUGE-AT-0042]
MPRLSDAGKKALDQLLAQTAKEGCLPGFVLAVSSVDEQLYAQGGGHINHDDPNSSKATPGHVFWLCSMSKLLTALAALQLIEKGVLSFDTPVSKYFAEFENPVVLQDPFTNPEPEFKPAKEIVTVYHLLTHTSGLYYGLGHEKGPIHQLPKPYVQEYEVEGRYEQFFASLKGTRFPGMPLVFEPGSGFMYGYSSDVLGFVIEKATGQSLDEYSKENIFKPLGLDMTYVLTEELASRMIDLHFRNADNSIEGWKDRLPIVPRYPKTAHNHYGGIGCFGTLPDYLTLLRHLLQIEAGRDVPSAILKRETVKTLFEPRLPPAGLLGLNAMVQMMDPESTDLDWSTAAAVNVKDWEGKRRAGSVTWSGWAGTWYFADPKTGIAMTFGSQIVPPMDKVTREILGKAEAIVYANLVN